MPDYTDNDAGIAKEIADNLLRDDEAFHRDFDEGFSIIDIQAHAAEFREDIEILSMIDAPVPALRVAEGAPVPVSLRSLGLGGGELQGGAFLGRPWRYSRYFRETIYDWFHGPARGGYAMFSEIEPISPEQARENFLTRATDFLATRVAAVDRWRRDERKASADTHILHMAQYAGGRRTNIPGCNFSVSSNTPKLSVYWSGAYYISSNYFGHPTSPTTATLQSGTYIFGVNGGAYGHTVQWDTNSVCSLPGAPSVHLQY